MSSPVTRAELREELARYPTKAELREELAKYPTKAELREELAKFATKVELREELAKFATKEELREELAKQDQRFDTKLETWGGALAERIKQGDNDLRLEMKLEMKTMKQEILDEMARLLKGAVEQFQRAIGVFDDPYRDLPPRVARLEAKVFPPKRTRRR